ncbi:MAG: FtsX-like permease family protein [Syntrophorhabdus sp. PtaU1.Bin153]|nr:MAG: FtsX-like permease family protein [Syntrophorhabdus sp. PtaU1.Bin153]
MAWIEKQRNILDFALSSLVRRWGKNLALVMVYTVIVFVLASILFMTHSIKREASLILRGSPEIVVQRILAGRHDLTPGRYIEKLAKIPGVREVKGRLWGYYYEPSTGANYTMIVTDEHRENVGTIAIGAGVARSSDVREGDMIPFRSSDGSYVSFEVTGVLTPESELVASDVIEVSERDFRSLFAMPEGYFTDLTLKVRNRKEVVVVADKIRRLLPDTRPILRDEILRTYDAIFDWRSGLLIVVFTGAILAFSIFSWDKATSLSFEEKKEMGVLKAVGWETSEVIAMKSWEGIVVSLTSFLLGVILAYMHVFFGSSILFMPVLKGWSVLYPHFKLVPYVDPYQLAALFFLTVVPYTAATIIPSWRAAIIDPDSVMRL